MKTKFFEIRDSGTFIPAMAIQLSGGDSWLVRRAGYGGNYILLTMLEGCETHYDIYDWNYGRTMRVAHDYIIKNWDSLANEQVICVESILGEIPSPKQSERQSYE